MINENKKYEIHTSNGCYGREAIKTHFVQIGEDYIDLVNRYVKPRYGTGDILSISEKNHLPVSEEGGLQEGYEAVHSGEISFKIRFPL